MIFTIRIPQVLGNAKVRQVSIALFVQQDIGWLEVAVDNPKAMGGVQRRAHLIQHRQEGLQAQRTFFEPLAQAAAAQQAHHQVSGIGFTPVII